MSLLILRFSSPFSSISNVPVHSAKFLMDMYIWRWKNKNGLEDLKKARWYLDTLINSVEFEENVPKPKEE